MELPDDSLARIAELESRQDAALGELELLERRIEQVLSEQLAALARLSKPTGLQIDRAA